ncbi:MAG: 30S ribosomal protein S20 [Candidatus Nomurabacteria bacterium]|jgi:ribosomal protein S20|nr:30S ribosomal protein S20 [Candidatus Nomurabacteria bacterium]
MPIIKSAVKKMKQDQRRYARNLRTKRAMRTAVKAFETKPSFDTLREAQSTIDTAVKKNVMTKAAAARRMSHLSATAKKAGVKIVTVKKAAAKPVVKPTTKPATKAATKPAVKKTTAKKPAAKTTTKSATKK